ncbi:MAG: hypothetical protein ABIG61_09695 [Planctomycetota bacterium]
MPEIVFQAPNAYGVWSNSIVVTDSTGAYVMADPTSAYNAVGQAHLTIPVVIPDGEYTVTVRLQTDNVVTGGAGVWAISLGATTGSIVENGGGSGGWHTYYPSTENGTPSSTWFASPDGDTGWFCPVYVGSPLPTSVSLSGIVPGDLTFHIWDQVYQNYTYEVIDYFEFIPEAAFHVFSLDMYTKSRSMSCFSDMAGLS